MRTALAAMIMSLFGCSAMAPDRLPVPPGVERELTGSDAAEAAKRLDSLADSHLRTHGAREKGRYFELARGTDWIMLRHWLDAEPDMRGAERVKVPWSRPGIDLVELWSLGGKRGAALAMTKADEGMPPYLAVYSITLDVEPPLSLRSENSEY